MADDVTTIKVTKPLRDRIKAAAARRDQTVQGFIENIMDEHDRDQRLAAVAAAISNADEETLADWRAETAEWAALDSDVDGSR